MKQTIEQLEGDVWGEPEFQSHLVTTCHRLRKMPIDEFTVEDLRIMIGQNIGTKYLLPLALAILVTDPLAEGDYYQGDLLKAVINLPDKYWFNELEAYNRLCRIVSEALKRLKSLSPQDVDTSDHNLIQALVLFQNMKVR